MSFIVLFLTFDFLNRESSDAAKDERKNKRNRQYGYPPVTPSAYATDSIANETFDHLWEEVIF